ncbi:MAG: hypothetical protein HDS14_04515 [Bacteroides sp.]|nr:hypothetical protein [Bacteroides sp.]
MIELLSIQPISNVVAIDFNYCEPGTLVANYWYPKFAAIYSSNFAPSGREINLHQIFLRSGAFGPTVVQFNEESTSESKVKDFYIEEGHSIEALSYLNESNFRALFECFQRRNNADYGSDFDQKQKNTENAKKGIHSLIEELRGNGIALPSDIDTIASTIVSEITESTDFIDTIRLFSTG